MAISGNLEDVSVADVLQFIHLGRRTGTLMLRRDGERGTIGFHRGKLVSAGSPETPRLGTLLVREGLLDPGQVDEAVQAQDEEPERRSLGQILLSRELVSAEDLRRVIANQIEATISELVAWDRGTFEFVVDDLRPVDDIALYPGDVVPDADINTQMVLLEAARIFDERNRDGGSADDTHPAFSPEPQGGAGGPFESFGGVLEPAGIAVAEAESEWAVHPPSELDEIGVHRLQIVTSDGELTGALDRALPPGFAAVEPVGVRTAGHPVPGHEPPIVVLDLRENGVSLDELARLRRTRFGTPLVALVAPGEPTGKLYEAGALATVPPEVEAIVACVENLARNRPRSAPVPGGEALAAAAAGHAGSAAGVERLRRVFGDLRSGLISATVALNLMHIISESVERAVLFLVKRDRLFALGAFGASADGQPLAELTRGMNLSLDDENALTESFRDGQVVSVEFEEAGLPERFASILGTPTNGRVVIFPVLGSQRVISVIYTDNGENEGPIEDVDILELATAQVGMAFENELLRRQIDQRG